MHTAPRVDVEGIRRKKERFMKESLKQKGKG